MSLDSIKDQFGTFWEQRHRRLAAFMGIGRKRADPLYTECRHQPASAERNR